MRIRYSLKTVLEFCEQLRAAFACGAFDTFDAFDYFKAETVPQRARISGLLSSAVVAGELAKVKEKGVGMFYAFDAAALAPDFLKTKRAKRRADELKKRFGLDEFRPADAAEVLEINNGSAYTVLNDLYKLGLVFRTSKPSLCASYSFDESKAYNLDALAAYFEGGNAGPNQPDPVAVVELAPQLFGEEFERYEAIYFLKRTRASAETIYDYIETVDKDFKERRDNDKQRKQDERRAIN